MRKQVTVKAVDNLWKNLHRRCLKYASGFVDRKSDDIVMITNENFDFGDSFIHYCDTVWETNAILQ